MADLEISRAKITGKISWDEQSLRRFERVSDLRTSVLIEQGYKRGHRVWHWPLNLETQRTTLYINEEEIVQNSSEDLLEASIKEGLQSILVHEKLLQLKLSGIFLVSPIVLTLLGFHYLGEAFFDPETTVHTVRNVVLGFGGISFGGSGILFNIGRAVMFAEGSYPRNLYDQSIGDFNPLKHLVHLAAGSLYLQNRRTHFIQLPNQNL